MKLISVIVPVYNAEKFLSQCIESILGQTYKNIELILINDGSTDNSLNICYHYKALDSRVIVIDKKNEGVSATRNLGLEIARGDYIGFVDSDDYIEKNMYETLLTQLEKDGSEVVAMIEYSINQPVHLVFDDKTNIVSGREALKNLLLLRFPTSLWAYLYSKDALGNMRLNEDIHFFEDFEFNFRVLSKVNKVSVCKHKLYNYRLNEGSINMQKLNDKKLTCLKVYDSILKYIQAYEENLDTYANYFRAHCMISIIASASKSPNVDQKYYKVIRKESKKILRDIIFSKYVPLKYKLAISMCAFSPYIFCGLFYLMKCSLKYLLPGSDLR